MTKVYIVEDDYKEKFIVKHSRNQLNDFKVYSKTELLNRYYDHYLEAELFLIENGGLNYETANEYLRYLPFLKLAETPTLKKLNEYQELLINNGKVSDHQLFRNFLKNQEIIFYHLNYDRRLDEIKNSCQVVEIGFENKYSTTRHYYEFSEIDDEIMAFFEEVGKLLDQGIAINKIKYVALDHRYNHYLNIYKHLYGININETRSYCGSKELIAFIENLDTYQSFEKAYELIDQYSPFKEAALRIINEFETLSDYCFDTKRECVLSKLKNSLITKKYTEALQEGCFSDDDDDYIFILGFNDEYYPKIIRNRSFISDDEKKMLAHNTTVEDFEVAKKAIINLIHNHQRVYISYTNKIAGDDVHLSQIANELSMIKDNYLFSDERYSKTAHTLRLNRKLDNLRRFHEKNTVIDELYSVLGDQYDSYNHQYNGHYQEKELHLSYSTLSAYNMNPFSYFVTKVLGINSLKEKFVTVIGTYLHEVMERCVGTGINYLDIKDELFNKYQFSHKECILINNLDEEILYNIDFINGYHLTNGFIDINREEKVEIELQPGVFLKGFIDKLIIKDGLFIIIDYKKYSKTASKSINYLKYGINNQLPMYIYLIHKTRPELKFGGVFLNYLLLQNSSDEDKNYDTLKKDGLKLVGYVSSENNRLNIIDQTSSTENKYLKIRITKNGSLYKGHGFNDEEVSDILDILENRLLENIQAIKDGEYQIAPLYLNGKACDDYGGSYYREISYVEPDDYNYIDEEDE
ncbi:MAG: PD-(D/E)XK nuclease family protein [Erysipelotrichaceae bacterium]|nr:PD-(D/E)XK nuclease family protein [Erysipelotrichaceae bacterium]